MKSRQILPTHSIFGSIFWSTIFGIVMLAASSIAVANDPAFPASIWDAMAGAPRFQNYLIEDFLGGPLTPGQTRLGQTGLGFGEMPSGQGFFTIPTAGGGPNPAAIAMEMLSKPQESFVEGFDQALRKSKSVKFDPVYNTGILAF